MKKLLFLLSFFSIFLSAPAFCATKDYCDRVGDFTKNVADLKASGSSESDVIAQLREQGLPPQRFRFNEGLIENTFQGPQVKYMKPSEVRHHFVRLCRKYGWQPVKY